MSETISGVSFNVSFMCQACKLIFKSVEMYCSHRLKFHYTQLTKFRCIVFKESIVEPTDAAALNFGTTVVVPPCKEFVNDDLTDKIAVDVKPEPSEEEDPISISNTVGVNIPLENEYFNTNNNFDDTRSSLIGPDVDVDIDVEVDVNLSDHQVEDFGNDHDPLEDFNDGAQFETESTSTNITETEIIYFNENSSDSDHDVICLDDPLLPTSSGKILSPTTSTTTLNNLVSSKLKLECQICSKTFTSSAQLAIHAAICQLYNSGKTRRTSATPGPGPVSLSEVNNPVITEKRERRRDLWVKCGNCSELIRRCHFKRHVQGHQKLPPGKASTRFKCQICGSSFRRKDTLVAHAGVHSEETPFKCFVDNCDAAFSFKSSFYRHLKIHTHSD